MAIFWTLNKLLHVKVFFRSKLFRLFLFLRSWLFYNWLWPNLAFYLFLELATLMFELVHYPLRPSYVKASMWKRARAHWETAWGILERYFLEIEMVNSVSRSYPSPPSFPLQCLEKREKVGESQWKREWDKLHLLTITKAFWKKNFDLYSQIFATYFL